jgi:hypothetical protein
VSSDIDYEWYVHEAQSLVDKVMGTHDGAKQLTLLDEESATELL